MAKLIQAIGAYSPRVAVGRTTQTRQLAEFISSRTSLNRSEIEAVLSELNETIIFFAKQGIAVKLAGVGTFTPTVNLAGVFDVGFRLDRSIDGALNVPDAFVGEISNRENIGKSADALKARWNAEHPNDPIA